MLEAKVAQMIRGILGNRCPNCSGGAVFRGIYAMNKTCPACGFRFEKEPGYFLGALVAAYFIGAFTVVPTIVVTVFVLRMELSKALGIGIAQCLICHPFLFRYSKLTWLYVEGRMTQLLDG